MHLMIDLECLSTRPDCVVLSIGACLFNPQGQGVLDQITIFPSVDEQLMLGRHVDDATLEWWGKQSLEAREEAFSDNNRVSFRDAILAVKAFYWPRADRIWAHGSCFDVTIMENCFRQLEINIPWPYWQVRDTRTLYELAQVSLKDNDFVTSHRAVDDAIRQAVVVQNAYRKLKLMSI